MRSDVSILRSMQMKRKDPYEPDPDMGFDMEAWKEENLENYNDYVNYDNPYEEYDLYDVTVVETCRKIVSVFARSAEDAKAYVDEIIEDIDMSKDIDEYETTTESVEESGGSDPDYTVPLDWVNV